MSRRTSGWPRVLSEGRRFEDAKAVIRDARKIKPRFAEISAIEGRNFKDSGDEEKAIASFKRAITEGGGFQPEANTGLGLLYKERAETAGSEGGLEAEKANYTLAIKYFTTAIKQLSGRRTQLSSISFWGWFTSSKRNIRKPSRFMKNFYVFSRKALNPTRFARSSSS